MDVIQVGLQKLNNVKAGVTMCRSTGDGRRNMIFLNKCPSYTLKCFHVNLEYTEGIYLATTENE